MRMQSTTSSEDANMAGITVASELESQSRRSVWRVARNSSERRRQRLGPGGEGGKAALLKRRIEPRLGHRDMQCCHRLGMRRRDRHRDGGGGRALRELAGGKRPAFGADSGHPLADGLRRGEGGGAERDEGSAREIGG